MQDLKTYFEKAEGTGILATSDNLGQVDAAVYARPHFMDDGLIAFIMRERMTHRNLQTNGKAVYLFMERGDGYEGKRLYLTKTREETDPQRIQEVRRREPRHCPAELETHQYLVYFRIDRIRPLVGDTL